MKLAIIITPKSKEPVIFNLDDFTVPMIDIIHEVMQEWKELAIGHPNGVRIDGEYKVYNKAVDWRLTNCVPLDPRAVTNLYKTLNEGKKFKTEISLEIHWTGEKAKFWDVTITKIGHDLPECYYWPDITKKMWLGEVEKLQCSVKVIYTLVTCILEEALDKSMAEIIDVKLERI